MRCLLLLVSLSCLWGCSSAGGITVINLPSMAAESPQRRNGSHVVPKQSGSVVSPGYYYLNPGEELSIESPNYPSKYPNNYLDFWYFETGYLSTIDFICEEYFDVKYSSECKRDHLQINDFDTVNYNICGSGYLDPIVDLTSYVQIKFKTNRRGRAYGFSCAVSAKGGASTDFSTETTLLSTETTTGSEATTDSKVTTDAPATTDGSGTGSDDCTCGVRNTASRIVGGEETTVHEYPWQVGLTSSSSPYCGGSIISDQWILTAAHCVDGTTTNDYVLIGEHNWSTTSETSVTEKRAISQAIVHPDYSGSTLDNDIALLKLAKPITFTSKISPVCLATPGNLYSGVNAVVSGWGTLTSGGSQPNKLNDVTVPTMTNAACKATGYSSSEITDNMICAGVPEGGKDSCQGDSGGPLVTGSPSMQQIGVVSWGYGCASPTYPGVYSRVSNYVSWIESKIAGSKTCSPAQ